jgi:hypothetical protein
MFGITCPSVLFIETAPAPPKHEKYCVNDSCPGHTRMSYVSRKSNEMQKHKFDVMCLDALFKESILGPLEQENNASMFRSSDALECTT